MKNAFTQEVNQLLVKLGLHPNAADLLDRLVIIVIILLIAWLADLFCRFVIVGGIGHIIKHTKAKWDDVLLHPQVLRTLTYLIPVLIVYMLLPLALSDKAEILGWLRKLCIIYGIVVVLVFINIFLKVLFGIFRNQEAFRDKPLKGLVQIMQVGLVCIGIILTISTLLNISPLHLLAGLGASAAILMLIFKDSILGFVSGIQLSINDMLRAGDWISMPKYDVDGTVLDVSLTTVKIENFDNTVTTIPPYTLTSDSFKNWRAMSESGGRRVMRSVNIDINSVRFCTPEMLEKYKRFALVRDYIEQEENKLETQRAKLNLDPATTFDTLRQSNIGIFRAYLNLYLKNLKVVNHDLTCMVRQLQPTETGIPIQLYFFSNIKEWVAYEGVQADVFDHVMSVIREFDLYIYQGFSGQDLQQSISGTGFATAPAPSRSSALSSAQATVTPANSSETSPAEISRPAPPETKSPSSSDPSPART